MLFHGSTSCPESLLPVSSSERMHALFLDRWIPAGQNGWLLDSKPAAKLLSTLRSLELTFPSAMFGGSGCSSLCWPEQSSQKGFLMQRQGEGPEGSHASEVCSPGTFPKTLHAAFPHCHASLVPVSFFLPLTCVNMYVHGNMGHVCIYSYVCGGQRHHLPLLRQGLSLAHIV